MSIRFSCAKCSKSLTVHDRFAERRVRCPACDAELAVPKSTPLNSSALRPALPSEFTVRSPKEDESADASTEDFEEESDPTISREATSASRYRSIRAKHEQDKEDLEWDITPMVDVAFLLLIFFMLTASFSIQRVIRTSSPISDVPSTRIQVRPDSEESVIVQIDEFNAYTVLSGDGDASDASSKQELIALLRDLRVRLGEQSSRLMVQAHVDSTHGAVVACLDAARLADFTNFQVTALETF